jgi:hypothetical protein
MTTMMTCLTSIAYVARDLSGQCCHKAGEFQAFQQWQLLPCSTSSTLYTLKMLHFIMLRSMIGSVTLRLRCSISENARAFLTILNDMTCMSKLSTMRIQQRNSGQYLCSSNSAYILASCAMCWCFTFYTCVWRASRGFTNTFTRSGNGLSYGDTHGGTSAADSSSDVGSDVSSDDNGDSPLVARHSHKQREIKTVRSSKQRSAAAAAAAVATAVTAGDQQLLLDVAAFDSECERPRRLHTKVYTCNIYELLNTFY